MANGFELNTAYVTLKTRGADKLEKELKTIDKRLNRLGTGTATKGLDAGFKNARRSVLDFNQAIGKTSNALNVIPAKGVKGMSALTGSIGTATAGMGAFSIATIGATAGLVALVGAAAGLTSAVRSAAALEKRLAEIATISPEVAKDIRGFTEDIGKLSIATRTESGLLAEGLYQTISAGITNTSDAFKVLEVSANAARAGLTDTAVAVDGITSVINAFGLASSEADNISDAFFKTVELGKTRFEDISASIGNVAPLASQLGVSYQEVLAAGAALTTGGKTLSESLTGVRGIMNAILRPSQEAVDISKELGIDFTVAALKAKGLSGFLRDLEIQAGGDVEVMGQLVGRVEGLQAVLALTGNQADTFTNNLNAIETSAGATDKALSHINNTLSSQIDLLKTQLSFALDTLGTELLPTVTQTTEDLNAALAKTDWDGFRNGIEFVISAMKKLLPVAKEVVKQLSGYNLLVPQKIPGYDLDQLAENAGFNLPGAIQNAQGLRTDLPTPLQQTAFQTTASPRPITTGATRAQRAIPTSEKDQRILAGLEATSTLTPGLISPQNRNITAGTGVSGFAAPTGVTTGDNIAGITQSPIPGVQGQLLDPSLGIADPSTPSMVADTLAPLAALEFPTTLPDDLKSFATAVGEMPAAFEKTVIPLQDTGALFQAEGEKLAGGFSLVGSAIEGGAHGGIAGAIIAVGGELLSMTEGFARVQDSWNRVVGQMVMAIEPVVSVLADALQPIFEALGEVMKAIEPSFRIMGLILKLTVVPAFKILGVVVKGLAKVIQTVWNTIIKAINFVIGLINKLPFVDIKKIPEAQGPGVPADQPVGTDPIRQPAAAGSSRSRSSGGLRVSAITGESRSILVDLLRPLRTLDNLFPAMLDELRGIRTVLTPGMRVATANAAPNAPNIQLGRLQDAADPNINRADAAQPGQRGGIFVENLNINVQEVADLNPQEINRQINELLDLQNRNNGAVFPDNR